MALVIGAVLLIGGLWLARSKADEKAAGAALYTGTEAGGPRPAASPTPTTVYAHNIRLRKGPTFRVYIRWIRGEMQASRAGVHPSLDDPKSFIFVIEKGVVHVNLGDIGNYLNSAVPKNFAFKNIAVTGDDDEVRVTGTLHKLLMPLPVELRSTVSSTSDGRLHLHVTKISVLKMPVKLLMRALHIDIADIMGETPLNGIEISGSDMYFDTPKLLPPPYIRGQLTNVSVTRPDLVLIYGNSRNDETRLSQWHNFLKLTGGTVDFAKLTMHDADLTLIDASDDPWFDLDLVNYKAQLVHGYSRMTPQLGLEIFMPDLDKQLANTSGKSITLDWLRNRDATLPPDVPVKK
ncbi:hypothetical protein BH10ACI4_BH10ACI4_14280 [soil metagenome]